MKELSFADLRVGMVLAQEIRFGDELLFDAGTVIRPSTLHLLRQRRVRRVSVCEEQEITADLKQRVGQTFRESIVTSTGTILDRIRHRVVISRDLVESTVSQVVEMIGLDARAMLNLYHARDSDGFLYPHAINTTVLAVVLARRLGLDADTILAAGMGALLHDIGMFCLPPEIVFKQGELNAEEWAVIQQHPERGRDELLRLPELPPASLRAVLKHQERLDGSGYPAGLRGDEIDLVSRIVMICDVYDAMISSRPWRNRIGLEKDTLRMMIHHSPGRLDEELLQEFLKIIPFFPPGVRVELSNGQIGRVVGLSENPFRPVIELLDREGRDGGVEIDLSLPRYFRMFIRRVLDETADAGKESG